LKINSNGYEFELDMLLACKYTGRSIVEQLIRTVYIEGNLFRIAREDADAIGKTPVKAPEVPPNAPRTTSELVWQQMRTCHDPEIPSTSSISAWFTNATSRATTTILPRCP
jgi:hypothetical protein